MGYRLNILDREIGSGQPVYIIAEMSANHGHSYDQAERIVRAAKDAGADAVKLQTYTPDTITIDCDKEYFRIGRGTIWQGRTLHELYREAYMPWEWQPRLKEVADSLGLHCFSSPFDASAVEFLKGMDVPAYKIASFENVDLPLIRVVAETGKPLLISTGMATLEEIEEAVNAAKQAGSDDLALLKCTSAYPAPPEEMNLSAIPHLAETFRVPVGLSDHTLGMTAAVAAVSLGACIIEKHLTLSRDHGGPDAAFSLGPQEFQAMVQAVRDTTKAVGRISYNPTKNEIASRVFRRSLFVVDNMIEGETFSSRNVRSIRPGQGLPPKYYQEVLGKKASCSIERGTPLVWDLIA